MAESKVLIKRPSSANTPPNCAICLGSCSNKCFSDSCMHQFCYQCLLEWSRIKAECPLCKQPFKSIIHNVKSNEEYDEHRVETPRNDDVRLMGNDDMWFLPIPLTPHRHEFHVRTTFTVDSRGEHAIQQMLLTHPLTTGGRITVGTGYPSSRAVYPRQRRDFSATSFRRSIYAQNLWVNAIPDISGRYRECSPTFYRNNPAARQRLTPWLNRELNALLYENTQLIMHLVDFIMDNLLRHHICSRTFRNLLREYLDNKTDHFVHEFYSFMRSPFDMIGYDRHVIYTSRPQSPAPILEDDTVEIPDDNSDDSDVVLVSASNPAEPVTIDLVESNSDSDEPIMVSSNNQVPMPLPPLNPPRSLTPEPPPRLPSPVTLVNLPPKLRHKHKALQEKDKHRWTKKRRHRSRSRSSSSSSSSDQREKESYKKYKRRKMMKKLKHKRIINHIDSSDSTTEVNITSSESDSDENKPLIDIIRQKRKKNKKIKKERKRKISRHEDLFRVRETPRVENPTQIYPMDLTVETPSCSRYSSGPSPLSNSRYRIELPKTRSTVEYSINDGQYTSVQIETSSGLTDYNRDPSTSTKIRIVRNGHDSPQYSRENRNRDESGSSGSSTEPYRVPMVKSEIREIKHENPEPSTSKPIPLVLKREHNKWYVFGESDSSD